MQVRSKRTALGVAAVAAVAFAVPTFANPGNGTGGSQQTACADGTVTWSPTSVWPPNHRMQTIDISYVAPADAPGDKTTITVGMITDDQSAPDGTDELNGSGNPNEGLDWAGIGNTATSDEGQPANTTAQVRAERSGRDQTGRTYSIQVMCSEQTAGGMVPDPADSGMATLTVTVPHDQGNHTGQN
jgi:hypothetical protein